MMLRKSTLSLTLTAALVVAMMAGGAAAAALDDADVHVNARIAPFAELSCVSNIDLGDFTGRAYEQLRESGSCTMKANTDVNISMQFDPLSSGGSEIGTAVEFGRLRDGFLGQLFEYLFALRRINGPWARGSGTGGPPMGFATYLFWPQGDFATRTNVQGQEQADYGIRVWGKLGDIHDQPAGEYSTVVTLTVSK